MSNATVEVFNIQSSDADYIAGWFAAVEAANKKAAKAGLGAPFGCEAIDAVEVHRKIGGVLVADIETVLEVRSIRASIEGWSFAATVDWSTETPVIRTSPFYEGPTLPRPETQVCEHCNTVRRRNDTYLVAGPDGAVKQVGKQCLEAYTGIPLKWVNLVEGLRSERNESGSFGGRVEPTLPLVGALALTAALVNARGFTSAKAARDREVPSTKDDVLLLWYGPRTRSDRERHGELLDAIEARGGDEAAIEAEVNAVRTWAAAYEGDSDYLLNLRAILSEDRVTERNLGFAVSAISSHRRDSQRQAERSAAKAKRAPVATGRFTITGTVTTIRTQESQYGETVKVRIACDTGSEVWGTLPSVLLRSLGTLEEAVGRRVSFAATVEPSKDDNTFGFYSRPSKARWL